MRFLMSVGLFLLLMSSAFAEESQEPVCDVAAQISHVQARHKSIDDAAVIEPVLRAFNEIEPVSNYKADTIYLIELPREFVQVVFVEKDCVTFSMAMPIVALKGLLDSAGGNP